MAKKEKKSQTKSHTASQTPRWRFLNVVAFIALTASAILFLIGPIMREFLNWTHTIRLVQILSMLAQYCLLVAIAVPAWYFVRGKHQGWRIFYVIMLLVYVAATVLGVTLGI